MMSDPWGLEDGRRGVGMTLRTTLNRERGGEIWREKIAGRAGGKGERESRGKYCLSTSRAPFRVERINGEEMEGRRGGTQERRSLAGV